ncbi:hypothetical protein [Thiolapillus sp.]
MFEKDPRTFAPDYKKLSPEQKAMVKLEISLTRFFRSFDESVRRWERMVYPAMIILGLLGLSGFYLIYHVTKDMHSMSQSFDPAMESNMAHMSRNIAELSGNITTMTAQINLLVKNIQNMDQNIAQMNGTIGEIALSFDKINDSMDMLTGDISRMRGDTGLMAEKIDSMDTSIQTVTDDIGNMKNDMRVMTINTGLMGRDMRQMNKPMRAMNSFMPW